MLLCQFARGDVYFYKDEYQKAIEDYTNGLNRVSNIEALSRRAEAYEKLGQRDKALADFKAVLEEAPGDKGAVEGVARLTPERQQ